jgi:polyhydroxyalkanoate synthesis regulator phasin
MREQLDLRQDDIRWGQNEGEKKAKASMKASMKAVAKQMVQEGKMTTEQVEEFLTRMEGFNQSQKKNE